MSSYKCRANLIAEKLEGLPQNIVEYILNQFSVTFSPGSSNKYLCLTLARLMLKLGPFQSGSILNYVCEKFGCKNIKAIFLLLEPFWVDPFAAACVSKCAWDKAPKNAILLNASDFNSAKMYIRRSIYCPPDEEHIYTYINGYGVDTLADIIRDVNELLIHELVSKESKDKHNELKRKLIELNERKKPIFVVLEYSEYIAEFLPKLQSTFDQVIFFLLTGYNFPDPKNLGSLRYEYIEPRLELDEEYIEIEKISQAYEILKKTCFENKSTSAAEC